jgi:hypothetical protein
VRQIVDTDADLRHQLSESLAAVGLGSDWVLRNVLAYALQLEAPSRDAAEAAWIHVLRQDVRQNLSEETTEECLQAITTVLAEHEGGI